MMHCKTKEILRLNNKKNLINQKTVSNKLRPTVIEPQHQFIMIIYTHLQYTVTQTRATECNR